MPRKYRFLAALLGVLLVISLASPILADEVTSTPVITQGAEGDILPPNGDDSPILPPDDGGEPSGDPMPDPGDDPSSDPASDPSSDPSSDPGSDDPSDEPPSDDPSSDPGDYDPDGSGNENGGDGDEYGGWTEGDSWDNNNGSDWDGGYTYEPSDSFEYDAEDDNFAGGTVTNTAPGSTGSTTPRRPQQVLGGGTSSAPSGDASGSLQVSATAEPSGPQYVTFAKLNLRSNSISLTLFYGGAGCIALGILGLILLLIVLVRSSRKNHRDRLIEEIALAEDQARSTETAAVSAPAAAGRYTASHMRSPALKHAAPKKIRRDDL